jgi:hypothetical protein
LSEEVLEQPEPEPPARPSGLRWWKEVLYIAAFYAVYSLIRNTQGSATVSEAVAFSHAREVIDIERAVGLYFEEGVQDAFLDWRWFVQFWNLFYGTFHFVVTISALVLLFQRFPARYSRWRNTLAATTGLALIGFAAYPLMPPRLRSRALIALYPAATTFAIVVTANHFWLDAAGGALVLGVGALLGFRLAAATARHPVEEPVPNRA